MACSKYEYVKEFEQHLKALPQVYMVIRIDGKGFTKFSSAHNFIKPNDTLALNLMNISAQHVIDTFPDIFLAYGQSDEYSFVLQRDTNLFSRRIDKIVSNIVSAFTSCYAFNFEKVMKQQLLSLPVFDGRCVQYPNQQVLRDYLSWRQVDCHINNLYNTCFWALIQKQNKSNREADQLLKNTLSEQKHQLLFEMDINYNSVPEIFKKGSVVLREQSEKKEGGLQEEDIIRIVKERVDKEAHKYTDQHKIDKLTQKIREQLNRKVWKVVVTHQDIIQDTFWNSLHF